jgi:hypothetical protein
MVVKHIDNGDNVHTVFMTNSARDSYSTNGSPNSSIKPSNARIR